MKIEGHELKRSSVEYVVIPRGTDPDTREKIPDVIFHCRPVTSYDGFTQRCPDPKPPEAIKAGGIRVQNTNDPTYLTQTERHAKQRVNYLIIESLRATPGLEWETVDYNDPTTWENYQQELQDAGFSIFEINRVIDGCLTANGMSQKRVDEALANFLHSTKGV